MTEIETQIKRLQKVEFAIEEIVEQEDKTLEDLALLMAYNSVQSAKNLLAEYEKSE